MRRTLSALAVGAALLMSAAASESAEKRCIPVLMDTGGTVDLYWMKLNANGSLAAGPVLVRHAANGITSAAIVPQGNKMLYAEYVSADSSQIFSVGLNPKNGTVTNGPTQLTAGSTNYFYYGLSIAKDGRKFTFNHDQGPGSDFDVYLKKLKPNGSVGPGTTTIAATDAYEIDTMITDDGLGVYYSTDTGGEYSILFQKLKAKGSISGAPVTAVTYPGEYVGFPRVDAKRGWMSYVRGTDIWVTRVGETGAGTGTPVKVTSVAPGYYAFGGLTRDARILVYTVWGGPYPHSHTLYSQMLDSNGNPSGAPVVLIPTSTNMVFAWDIGYW